jgi:DNA-binding NarL/FixJ family response regulator
MQGPPAAAALIEDGWRALEQADWDAARSAFAAALADGDPVEARDGLAQTMWFLGDVAEAIALRGQAFDEYARAGRCDDAARIAVWVAHQHAIAGRSSAARGWMARCERVLGGVPVCAGHGWLAVERARLAPLVEEQIAEAARAVDIGRTFRASDVEVLALSVLGAAEVSAGHRHDGMLLLEEAMAAATAGRIRDLHALGSTYCNLIAACAGAGEWERAAEWCEVVEDFSRGRAVAPLFGVCRTVHADVLLAKGRWAQAETALEEALAAHTRSIPEMSAPTIASLAELRVQQGRLPEAEELLSGREEHPSSLRALALLRLADGRPRQAVTLLERGLRAASDNAVVAAGLLAPLVEARLALHDDAGARAAADDLAGLAAGSGIRLLAARADMAAASVAVAGGDGAAARDAAQRALAGFGALLMPLDAGLARLALARALAGEDPETAREEARAALGAFRELGASRAMDAAAAVLRELGAGQGGRPRAVGDLTSRELEVLGLVALGMSNAAIARSLLISERTAGHHVGRVLAKLGVRNRAEAAAFAARGAQRPPETSRTAPVT